MKIEKINEDNAWRYQDDPTKAWHAIRFLAGSLYRAVLGYDVVNNKEEELNHIRHLDCLLNKLDEIGEYHIKLLKAPQTTISLRGVEWKKNLPPPLLPLRYPESSYNVRRNSVMYYRFERKLSGKNRHDFEFVDTNGIHRILTLRSYDFDFKQLGLKEVRSETICDFSKVKK